MIVIFSATSYNGMDFNPILFVFLSIFVGEFSVFFIKILKAELSGGLIAKAIGLVLMLFILLICW
jgi:hypothetical protein